MNVKVKISATKPTAVILLEATRVTAGLAMQEMGATTAQVSWQHGCEEAVCLHGDHCGGLFLACR